MLVPLGPTYADMDVASRTSCGSSPRSNSKRWATLLTISGGVDHDLIRFRRVVPPEELPVSVAAQVTTSVRDLLSASALAARQPRPFCMAGQPPAR